MFTSFLRSHPESLLVLLVLVFLVSPFVLLLLLCCLTLAKVRWTTNTTLIDTRVEAINSIVSTQKPSHQPSKMRLLFHTALLATAVVAAPAANLGQESDTGHGGYHGSPGDSKASAHVDSIEGRGGHNSWDSGSKESSYAYFSRRWHRGRDSQRGSCDLRNAVMPAGKSSLPNIGSHLQDTTN